MAKSQRGTFAKRRKEMARQEKQREKRAQRLAAKEDRTKAVPGAPGEDPDLAGIRLGPQPPPEDEWSDDHDEADEDTGDALPEPPEATG